MTAVDFSKPWARLARKQDGRSMPIASSPITFIWCFETPQPKLVPGMKRLLGTYTSRFNRRHQEFGHVFSGRYKSLIVDASGNGHLKTVRDYVHLNSVRADLLRANQSLQSLAWSSFGEYLKSPARRLCWLRADRPLGEWAYPRTARPT